jgi:antitoxin (DNA-binding transcriptional repressor) of toxin-antitoxin stability system
MSVRITVRQAQEQLPELLDHTVESGEECIIERDGQEYAVLISARAWRQRDQSSRARHRSEAVGASGLDSSVSHGLEGQSDPDPRLREIGAKLDALGPEYRLPPEKQARAEELLAKGGDLDRAERRELRALLRESDAIMLRRAEALERIG